MSGREVVSLTVDRLGDLPEPCAGCIYWELQPALTAASVAAGTGAAEKAAWLSQVLLEWGSAGQLVYVDGRPAGYITYAPPHLVPRSPAFATTPISADAVLLMTARIDSEFRGQGLGRVLVQSAAKDVLRRGVRALEAFARVEPALDRREHRSRGGSAARDPLTGCLVPAGFLAAVGFTTVRPHPKAPRMRLDLRTAVTLREDVEQAWERLLSSVRVPALGQGQRA